MSDWLSAIEARAEAWSAGWDVIDDGVLVQEDIPRLVGEVKALRVGLKELANRLCEANEMFKALVPEYGKQSERGSAPSHSPGEAE